MSLNSDLTAVENSISRRAFLMTGAAGAAAISLGRTSLGAQAKDPYLGFKMGLQSYSLREFKPEVALEHTKALGLKYWE
ncbi:MAG: hypothetical protein FJ267_17160, partial [Planctomycetes bacterium]|nr:hypothetical protein [Planctomycetota bacterium]